MYFREVIPFEKMLRRSSFFKTKLDVSLLKKMLRFLNLVLGGVNLGVVWKQIVKNSIRAYCKWFLNLG